MTATRPTPQKTARTARRACPQAARPASPARTLRSRPGSALIDGSDDPFPTGHPSKRRGAGGARRGPAPGGDDLARAEVVVCVERAKPGSPLDERLRREQTLALLDLLADHVARRRANPDT
jgi:hypothetical protein